MIHQPLGGAQGQETDLEIQVNLWSGIMPVLFLYQDIILNNEDIPVPISCKELFPILFLFFLPSWFTPVKYCIVLQVNEALFWQTVNAKLLFQSPAVANLLVSDCFPQANEMLHHKANLNGYLAYHTGQPLDKINEDTDRDYFMSAKEAKEYGLIDGVIMNPLKALQPLPASS